jgi:hypothetical protein
MLEKQKRFNPFIFLSRQIPYCANRFRKPNPGCNGGDCLWAYNRAGNCDVPRGAKAQTANDLTKKRTVSISA